MAVTSRLNRPKFKHIESEIYSYSDTKKEIDRLRKEIMFGNSSNDENIGGNRSLEPGRPTERIATRLLTHKRLRNMEEIVEAIDYSVNALTDEHRNLVRLKYWSRKRLSWDDLAIQLNMHRNTAMKLNRDVVYLVAEKIGWI
jgi:RinA family phage transcriptional activator